MRRTGVVTSLVVAAVATAGGLAMLRAAPASSAQTLPGVGMRTNYDFARLVLMDGGWPTSVNNETVLTQWLRAEEPPSDWWDRDNPLNNGLGSGGGSGLGSYRSVVVAAGDVARNLEQPGYGYPRVVTDLATSAAPGVTARAIWRSSWAAGHYGFGVDWDTTPVPVVAAPIAAWQLPVACPVSYPAGVIGPCGAGFRASGPWAQAEGGLEGRELWSSPGGAAASATWKAVLRPGRYLVQAFVPAAFSDALVDYDVRDLQGSRRVAVDQEPISNAWATLGTFGAGEHAGITVTLSTRWARSGSSTYVAADAMRFVALDGGESAEAVSVRPLVTRRAPGAPQAVSAVAEPSGARVSWLAPSKDGGSAIERYEAVAVPGGAACFAGAVHAGIDSCSIGGLKDGTTYRFFVRARNRFGAGRASVPSAPARPVGLPSLSVAVPKVLAVATHETLHVEIPTATSGAVLFSLDGVVLPGCGDATVVKGRAGCAVRFTQIGTHQLLVTYSGDSQLAGGEATRPLTIHRAATSFHAEPVTPQVLAGAPDSMRAFGLPGEATGQVVFSLGATRLCVAALSGGGGACAFTVPSTLPAGVYAIHARFVGDDDFQASAATTSLQVLAPAAGS